MNFSIVFENTGDSLPFETCSSEVAEVLLYYVDNLNNKNLNKFIIPSAGKKIQTAILALDSSLHETNKWIYEILDSYIETYVDSEYLDQRILNKLHCNWVNSQTVLYDIQAKRKKYKSAQTELINNLYPDEISITSVGTLVNEKLGYKKLYDSINLNIHRLEEIFQNIRGQVADQDWVEFDNPFSKTLLTNNIGNFSLSFYHPGRTLYNKFEYFDMDLVWDDENSYDQLLGYVTINLSNPQTVPLSKEYVDWCVVHNKIPSGDNFNIGNIKNLVNRLTDYRKIIFQNTLQNNTFSIQLTKG
jgi:hypothetical protein